MSSEQDLHFQLPQIEVCISKVIDKTTIQHEGKLKLTAWTIVWHLNMSFRNSQTTILLISVGGLVQNT